MVYEVKVELPAAAGRSEAMYQKLRGSADNALLAASMAGKLLKEGERVIAVKPLYDLDW